MAHQDNEQLERDIFGGSDSELSDEEDFNQRRKQSRRQDDEPAEAAEESSASDSDEYQDERAPSQAKRAKGTRKRRVPAGDGDESRPASKKRKRTKKSAGSPELTEEQLSEMTPEQARQATLDRRINEILKPKKANRPKKRKDEDDLDKFADEEVSKLKDAMNAAAEADEAAIHNKQPAYAKVKLLPEVMNTLRKAALAQSIVDNNLLGVVTRWLEPLPDKSLPSLNIQKEFFPVLKKMEFIDKDILKESKLGPIVIFYTKSKRVPADIRRIAEHLISSWSRPIIKRSASYRDRVVPLAESTTFVPGPGRGAEKLHSIMARAKETDKNRIKKNAVSIPIPEHRSYSVAPRRGVVGGGDSQSVAADGERRRRNADRLRSLARKVAPKT
ncbi:hypothetical protein BDV98DRAFT_525920 [Pterulicium gracile]|uniref:TFIIS N-terminal domain-containing protein n=1 Tax=Pterulicium gracile TaxID=1884261 RepID=A0A5C3QQ34_9AGAR|nr:hypothetical protein BDV98DRAFT_525920 [Pterula gracilis]